MINQIKEDNFDELFAIMEKSFPEDEHRPRDEQKELFENTRYRVYGNTESGRLSSVIATWEFDDFVFIEHFATHPEFRNRGLDKKMLEHLKSIYQKPLCLEVEIPDGELQRRRVTFYERNGFTLNHFPYIQPPISKGKKPVPLMIMTTGGALTDMSFMSIKRTLYREVYKADPNQ